MANPRRPQFASSPARLSQKRKQGITSLNQRFLIVCEGKKTEPNYFEAFRTPSVSIDVIGVGMNTLTLIDETIRIKAEFERNGDLPFDQVWCVFDRDSFEADDFNSAIRKAETQGFRVAYSNEAFELWYMLHFNYYDTGIHRHQYIGKLHDLLGRKYEKNSMTIYDDILSRQADAIRNAKRLLDGCRHLSPQKANPSTTVHLLVEELNKNVSF